MAKYIEKRCINCGEIFTTNVEENNMFCSELCKSFFEKQEPNMECIVCGKKMFVPVVNLRNNTSVSFKTCGDPHCQETEKKKLQPILHRETTNSRKFRDVENYYEDFLISPFNYIIVYDLNHPFASDDGYVPLHRIVFENYLLEKKPFSIYLVDVEGFDNQFLAPEIELFHVNGNKLDNDIENIDVRESSDRMFMNIYMTNNYKRVGNKYYKNFGTYVKETDNDQMYKKYNDDAGWDLTASEDITIKPKSFAAAKTGLRVAIPKGFVGRVGSRSGLSFKDNIEVGAGWIDGPYRGEVNVKLYNMGDKEVKIQKNQRLAQIVVLPCNLLPFKEVEKLNDDTARGSNGLGSTGK